MSNNGCGLILPCQHCGQTLGNHLMTCSRHESKRVKLDKCPFPAMPQRREKGGFIPDDEPRKKHCIWTHDADTSSWDTECGEKFIFCDDGGPGEDGFIYCPYCAGRLAKEY